MLLTLEDRHITVQFRVRKPGAVPNGIDFREEEAPEVEQERRSRVSGLLVIKPTANCVLNMLPGQLAGAGYELSKAFYQMRLEGNGTGRKPIYVVRFDLVRHEHAGGISDDFKRVRGAVIAAFQKLCEEAYWCTQVFSNPYYANGVEVPGQRALSINLAVRTPFNVAERKKDEQGKKIGEPIPITPNFQLVITDNQLQLIPA